MTDDAIGTAGRTAALRPIFIATILTGSFLLFLIQPMFARMILPLLGGSPSVWNVALLFYQAVLLLGYLYAHALQRFALRTQIGVHLVLLGLAALTLPVGVATWFPAAGDAPPALWLLGLLLASIGPAFFVVSAQSPLMQAWFARSSDPAAANPYFLYAASNTGSLAALLAYPLLVEPQLRLTTQAGLWAAGFAVLAVLVALAGAGVLRAGEMPPARAERAAAVTWRQRLHWTLLAAVPSGLLLATTTHLSTDVMAMPLLWVIPLALYLVSFIVAFSGAGARATRLAVAWSPAALIVLGGLTNIPVTGGAAVGAVFASLVLLFVLALALHGQLARGRPDAAQATEFYLWISVGGVVGGLFCAIVAPWLFDWVYEQPILLIAAALLVAARSPIPALRRLWAGPWRLVLRYGVPVMTALLAALSAFEQPTSPLRIFATIVIAAAAITATGHRRQLAWHLAMLLLTLNGWTQLRTSALPGERERTFFGIYTVRDSGVARRLASGTTLHGVQSLLPGRRLRPTSYYAPGSGVGLAFAGEGNTARVGFVGLGAGTLACYAKPGQRWTAFEIDPAMVGIARDQFGFVRGCKPDMRIVLGDARLSLAREPQAGFDLLAIDAFSSDAIPIHLMTREAFALYGRTLAPDGLLLVHISNRYFQLEPVVAALARDGGWTVRSRAFLPSQAEAALGDTRSTWIALSRSPRRIEALGTAWQPLQLESGIPAWSDDFASVLPLLKIVRPREAAGPAAN